MAASVSEAGTAQARRAARLSVEMASGKRERERGGGRLMKVVEFFFFFFERDEKIEIEGIFAVLFSAFISSDLALPRWQSMPAKMMKPWKKRERRRGFAGAARATRKVI